MNCKIIPNTFLAGFTYTRINLICESVTPISLPLFSGSAFRGIFGRSLKDLVCVAHNTPCNKCPIAPRCIYLSVFEVQPNPDLPVYRKLNNPPRPFVIEPPREREVQPEAPFNLGVTLFGNAIDHWPWVIQAFIRAGKKGVGRGLGAFNVRRALSTPTNQILVENDKIQNKPSIEKAIDMDVPLICDAISLAFETPVRVKQDGRLVDRLEFSTIVRQVLRRLGLLGAFHCGHLLEIDFKKWIRLAGAVECQCDGLWWLDWTRCSSRQKRTMKLGGVVGRAQYAGDLAPFAPLLKLGEIIHFGKSTTFGLGRYRWLEQTDE